MRRFGRVGGGWVWWLGIAGWLAAPVWGANLTAIDLGVTNGRSQAVVLRFSAPVEVSRHFQSLSPPRLVIDFAGGRNATGRGEVVVRRGEVERLLLLEGRERLRVVFLLERPVIYRLLPDRSGWRLEWTASGGQEVRGERGGPAPGGPVTLRAVDFRRGGEGQGKIVISLSTSQVSPLLTVAGPERFEVRFPGATVPETLRRRFDATDFATPVSSFILEQRGNDAVLTAEVKGGGRPLAYQSDTSYVVEVPPASSAGGEGAGEGTTRYQGERVSLDFQSVEVRALLQVLADFSGFNIVAADSVGGTITLRLVDVPWDQALDIILTAKGLDKRQMGNVIWVAPAEELRKREEERFAALNQRVDKGALVTQSFQVNYHSAAEIYQILTGRGGTGGGGAGGGGAGSGGTAAAGGGRGFLSPRGSATYDTRTNKLFVTDVEERLAAVRALLQEVDVPPRQVVIEARIVEATSNFGREIGLRLSADDARFRGLSHGALLAVGPFSRPYTRQSTAQELRLTDFTNVQLSIFNRSLTRFLDLELNLAEATGRGRIVSNPKILTANNVKAKISVGDEIPFVLPSTTNSPPSVSFKEAALNLEVTPVLTPDGRVRLSVLVEKNRADFTRTVLGNPPIVKKQITTDVIVENGGTVVLGGLFEESESRMEDQVPFLGEIPLVGRLFRNDATTAQRTELMIFLTPRVVGEERSTAPPQ